MTKKKRVVIGSIKYCGLKMWVYKKDDFVYVHYPSYHASEIYRRGNRIFMKKRITHNIRQQVRVEWIGGNEYPITNISER